MPSQAMRSQNLFDNLLLNAEVRGTLHVPTAREQRDALRAYHRQVFEKELLKEQLAVRVQFSVPVIAPARRNPMTSVAVLNTMKKAAFCDLTDINSHFNRASKQVRSTKYQAVLYDMQNRDRLLAQKHTPRGSIVDKEPDELYPKAEPCIEGEVPEQEQQIYAKQEPLIEEEPLSEEASPPSIKPEPCFADDIQGDHTDDLLSSTKSLPKLNRPSAPIFEQTSIVESEVTLDSGSVLDEAKTSQDDLSAQPAVQDESKRCHCIYTGKGPTPYQCMLCSHRLECAKASRSHLRKKHRMFYGDIRFWHPGYQCTFVNTHKCGRIFASLQRLNVHAAKEHGISVRVRDSQLVTCKFCGLNLPNVPNAVVTVHTHLTSHRWDGHLADVNFERAAQGKRPWMLGRMPRITAVEALEKPTGRSSKLRPTRGKRRVKGEQEVIQIDSDEPPRKSRRESK